MTSKRGSRPWPEPPPSPPETGNGLLQAAMTLLIQNRAAFVGDLREIQRENVKDLREIRRDNAKDRRENAERFARIEAILLDHSRVLAEHTRLLHTLPEAVCEKIVIGDGEIDITLSYLPSSEELCKNQTRL